MEDAPASLAIAERLCRATVVEVVYPVGRGAVGLRGSHAPLSWETTTPPTVSRGDIHIFELEIPEDDLLDVKLVRGEDDWAQGRNYALHAGDHLHLEPAFDRATTRLVEPKTLEHDGQRLTYTVLLPPSYDEQESKRYPVVYAQDGQSLWTTSSDPFGVWNLDATIDRLLELGVIEEIIVVGVDTSENRIDRLSPIPDEEHGGGHANRHLAAIVEALKPRIDAELRTKPGREDTTVMGSSMGGLFSFYAAWTRPDVFGKAICLSSSFWWANRHVVRAARTAPSPRPILYLDSGAALSAEEKNPGARDGFHDTRSMHRALVRTGFDSGRDVHRLTFPGETHDASAWAARIAIPLQLLFQPAPETQIPAAALENARDSISG